MVSKSPTCSWAYQQQSKTHQVGIYNSEKLKVFEKIWKNCDNIRNTPAVLRNDAFILPYFKVLEHPPQSDTPEHHSKSYKLVSGT